MRKFRAIAALVVCVFMLAGCHHVTWEEQLEHAADLMSQKQYEEAAKAFSAAIDIDPKRSDAYLGLADAYLGLGDRASAVTALDSGVEQAENAAPLKEELAEIYCAQGREHISKREYEQAGEQFRAALSFSEDNGDARQGLAEAEAGSGDEALANEEYDAALEHYGIALEQWATTGDDPWRDSLYEKQSEAYSGLGHQALAQGEYEDAIARFAKALELSPDRTDAKQGMAAVYLDLGTEAMSGGDQDKAVEYFETALAQDPANDDARMGLAEALFGIGKRRLEDGGIEEAESYFQQTIDYDPEYEEAYQALADVYISLGDLSDSAEILTKAVDEGLPLEERLQEIEVSLRALDTLWHYMEEDNIGSLYNSDAGKLLSVLSDHVGICYDGKRTAPTYSGTGLKVVSDQYLYYGELVDGAPQGVGSGVFAGEYFEHYSGQWDLGMPNGDGVLTTCFGGDNENVTVDEGTFRDGKGEGAFLTTVTYPSGIYIEMQRNVKNGAAGQASIVSYSEGAENMTFHLSGDVFVTLQNGRVEMDG